MNNYDNSVRLLANGFTSEFAEFCAGHERMHELMMELAEEFVQENIPVVHGDAKTDVAMELTMGVTITR